MSDSIHAASPWSATTKRRGRILGAAVLAAVIGLTVYAVLPKPLPELSREDFLTEIQSGHVRQVEIDDNVITGISATRGAFRTALRPDASELVAELRSLGVEIVYANAGIGLI